MPDAITNTDDLANEIIKRIRATFSANVQRLLIADHEIVHRTLQIRFRFPEVLSDIDLLKIMDCLGLPNKQMPAEIAERTTGVRWLNRNGAERDKPAIHFNCVINGKMVCVILVVEATGEVEATGDILN
jgi:hypothetical protein